MTRVKRSIATKKRHKRVLKAAKGFWGQRGNVFKRAKETLLRAMAYAFKGRKLKKRDMRALFIIRINAAARKHGLSYSRFISGLNRSQVQLNRKMISQLAVFEPNAFAQLVQLAKS